MGRGEGDGRSAVQFARGGAVAAARLDAPESEKVVEAVVLLDYVDDVLDRSVESSDMRVWGSTLFGALPASPIGTTSDDASTAPMTMPARHSVLFRISPRMGRRAFTMVLSPQSQLPASESAVVVPNAA